MKYTKKFIIVTADDFKSNDNANKKCGELIEKIGFGQHLYGGKYYFGHHVIFEKRQVKKTLKAAKELVMLM